MSAFLVSSPAYVENFPGIPVESPGITGPPVPVPNGGLNGVADSLRSFSIVSTQDTPEKAITEYLAAAKENVNLAIQDVDGNEVELELYVNKSRPWGEYWIVGNGLNYVHPAKAQTGGGGGTLPGVPYEPRGDDQSAQILAPLVVTRIETADAS